MKIVKFLCIFVGISGCFSVLFGAWLAHAGQILPSNELSRLSHALQYQFIHTLALLVTLIWYMLQPTRTLIIAAFCFVLGVICFSGSLYIKTFFDFPSIGKLAPLGGIFFALGWLFIGSMSLRMRGIRLKGKALTGKNTL
jgi:uncharacterized membrane protein YgdD (TMEM256/DUF423 family)